MEAWEQCLRQRQQAVRVQVHATVRSTSYVYLGPLVMQQGTQLCMLKWTQNYLHVAEPMAGVASRTKTAL